MSYANEIKDKSDTIFGYALTEYVKCKTPADQQKFLLSMHTAYYKVLDLFTQDMMKHLSSAQILTGETQSINGKPVAKTEIKQAVTNGVEPSGRVSAFFHGGVFELGKIDGKTEVRSPRKPAKGETILEGYWRSRDGKEFLEFPDVRPLVNRKPFEGKQYCLTLLETAERKGAQRHTKGWSNCRICDQKIGSTNFTYQGFKWPEGYRHYIDKHNVKPSPEFAGMLVTLTSKPMVIECRASVIEELEKKPEKPNIRLKTKPSLKSLKKK